MPGGCPSLAGLWNWALVEVRFVFPTAVSNGALTAELSYILGEGSNGDIRHMGIEGTTLIPIGNIIGREHSTVIILIALIPRRFPRVSLSLCSGDRYSLFLLPFIEEPIIMVLNLPAFLVLNCLPRTKRSGPNPP
ncbi:MAG: hypothetical protein QG577_1770 [Thermodesulfobacteriota bacterium]|nr:hypothetical protein [Thermodesulfobacteriota bacterium]